MNFGERLQAALDLRGITRADLCRMTGLKSSNLVPYMKPDSTGSPKLSTAVLIARALNVSLDWLGGRDCKTPFEISDEEADLLAAYRELDPDKRENIRSNARFLASEQRKSDVHHSEVTEPVRKAV